MVSKKNAVVKRKQRSSSVDSFISQDSHDEDSDASFVDEGSSEDSDEGQSQPIRPPKVEKRKKPKKTKEIDYERRQTRSMTKAILNRGEPIKKKQKSKPKSKLEDITYYENYLIDPNSVKNILHRKILDILTTGVNGATNNDRRCHAPNLREWMLRLFEDVDVVFVNRVDDKCDLCRHDRTLSVKYFGPKNYMFVGADCHQELQACLHLIEQAK